MILYLARHGQTTGDVEDRYGGDYDDHVTDEGKRQAANLADQLAGKGIEKLFASPRIRAQETAAIVGQKLGLAVLSVEAFRERNGYGILTGMTKTEAQEKYPDQVAMLKDVHAAIEGAEAYLPFQARITEALDAVRAEAAQTIAVITHGGLLRLIFRDILKLGEINISDCAYAVLDSNDRGLHVVETHGIDFNQA